MHTSDRLLLGMRWREKTYIDSALPFGLRSAPKVLNAVADAMQWILEQHGVKPMLHYLDDFLVIGTRECKQALETALGLFRRLGIPISVHKTEGPSDIPATSAGMTCPPRSMLEGMWPTTSGLI